MKQKSAFAIHLKKSKQHKVHQNGGVKIEVARHNSLKKDFKLPKKIKPSKKLKNFKLKKKVENRTSMLKDSLILTNKPAPEPKTKILDPCGEKKKKLKQSKVEANTFGLINNEVELSDSSTFAEKTFQWFIHPIKPAVFFKSAWEKKPILIRRHDSSYYKNIFGTKDFNKILKEEEIFFTTNIDITVYKNGKRQTLNPTGRAYASRVWTEYEAGHSIRMLNPQSFSKNVWNLLTTLQEFFNCGVGANMYLTPPGSQGFAPHYDDIEAFVIQLEGQKKWKLYEPRTTSEDLPRFSSDNFTEEEIGKPILDICLNEGDMLYFPRGIIHQASTPDDSHSLHLTVSTFQKNTWTDFLEKLMPRALQCAADEVIEFRRGLPIDYLSYMGVANSDMNDPRREKFLKMVENLMKNLFILAPVDAAVDQFSKEYIHNCLPPYLTEEEKKRSIFKDQIQFDDGKVSTNLQFQPSTEIRLIRKNILRLVAEEVPSIYHYVNNSRVYREREIQSFEVTFEVVEAVERLQHAFPKFLKIGELPINNGTECMEFALQLYKRGLIMTKIPMPFS